MAALALSSLSSGSDVFIDANVFIYGLSSQSEQSQNFLRRCSREEVYGVTLFEIVNEATHRFMVMEAFTKGLITRPNAGKLQEKPDAVRTLADYWKDTQRILSLNLLFLATEEHVLRSSQQARAEAGLLTNDSMVVACMRNLGITSIASADSAFERVSGLTLYSPTDLTS